MMSFMRNSGDPSNSFFFNKKLNNQSGSRCDKAKRYSYLEVGQLHSSEEACEQNLKKKMAEWVERRKLTERKSANRNMIMTQSISGILPSLDWLGKIAKT